jgi:hypothetical protein
LNGPHRFLAGTMVMSNIASITSQQASISFWLVLIPVLEVLISVIPFIE